MLELGWRETISLPDLGITALRSKIDTGARTSALHAVDFELFERDGVRYVEFHVPLPGEPQWKRSSAPLVDDRAIKNTSGLPENRYVVETTLVIGRRHWHIEVSLADREQMEFDLIIGRTAIRGRRLLINPGRSYLAGSPVPLTGKSYALPHDGLIQTLRRGKPPARVASIKGENQ